MPDVDPKSHEIVLRPAVPGDVSAIVALEWASFRHPEERFEPRRVRHLMDQPRLVVTVAECDGRFLGWVAGFVWLRGRLPWGRVYAIAVDPRARGQKLGLRLMHYMIGALERRGAAQIYLEVRPDNHAALQLYEKLGFVGCRTLPNFYGAGLTALRMLRVSASSPAASP